MKTSDIIWQDAQHQVLLKLIDDINSSQTDHTVFLRLYDYARHHFTMEEEYMRQLGYPEIDAHIAAHDKFRKELDTMVKECRSYDENFRQFLSEFLSEWLKGHIFSVDKHLEEFILKSEAK